MAVAASADTAHDFGWALGTLLRAYLKQAHAAFKDLPGGPRAYQVMSIAASETCETQAAIAERIGLDRTAMTHLIDGLESHKLVRRIPDAEDRRARHVALTARGRTVLAEMTERVEHIERSVLAGLSPADAGQLRTILLQAARLVDNGSNSVDVCPASDTDVIKPSASRV